MDAFIIINGVKVFYQAEGQGEPLILLHGNGLSHGMWKYNVGPLSGRYRVYAPDLPGFGRSDKPDVAYGAEYYLRFLEAFMDGLQIEKASLVGHSFLGVVAATFAVRHPERVQKLVLADACSVITTGSPYYRLALKAGLRLTARSRTLFVRQMGPGPVLSPALGDVPLSPDSRESRVAFYRNCNEILDLDTQYFELIAGVKAPTLVLGGSVDRLAPPQGLKKYGEIIRSARTVVLDGCGHLPNVEEPDRFNAEVLGFLA